MIIIIDSGLGNVRSIYSKIAQMGEDVQISDQLSVIESADKLVLPGVGHFSSGMENITEMGLLPVLKKKVKGEKIPLLGICLGMQLLTNHSEEGNGNGLSFIDAETIHFSNKEPVPMRIPHMGWNTIKIENECPLLHNIPDNSRFYFVHSYHVSCNNQNNIIATTNYGHSYPSIIQNGNIFGVQFHPEKSHKQGIQLIKNFVSY